MEFRYLGNSGLKISEIVYGNWLTHGSQVENDTAAACVRAALDVGISSFDTADVYANGAAEQVLGDALKGERRESLEIFTKVYWPTGPKGHNDTGLSRKHILESIDASLRRLGTDYVDLYQAHRYDHETPLEETMQAFADVVRSGRALYIGVSEWTADQLLAGHALAGDLGFQLISNQPEYSALYRVIEPEIIPAAKDLGVSQIVFSPMAQGVLTGKYLPGAPPPAGSRATDEKGGANFIQRFLRDDVLTAVQQLIPIADGLGRVHEPTGDCLGAGQRQRRRRHRRGVPAGAGDVERRRRRAESRRRHHRGRRRRGCRRRRARPGRIRFSEDQGGLRSRRALAEGGASVGQDA